MRDHIDLVEGLQSSLFHLQCTFVFYIYYVFLGFNCCQYFWGVCVSKLLARWDLALWVIRHWVAYYWFFLSFTSIQLNLWYSMAHYSQGLDSLPASQGAMQLAQAIMGKNKFYEIADTWKKVSCLVPYGYVRFCRRNICRITHLGWLSLITLKCSFQCFLIFLEYIFFAWLTWIAGSHCVLAYYSSMHFNMGELHVRFKSNCLCHWIGFVVGFFAFSVV